MSSYTNVYNTPEHYGLEIIDTLDDETLSWEFDTLLVFRHTETGKLYYAADSGCSCPSPFEDYTALEHLDEITDETWDAFQKAVEEHAYPDYRRSSPDPLAADKTECLAKVARLLRVTQVVQP